MLSLFTFFLISKLFLLPGYMAGNIPPIGNAEEKKNKNGQGIYASKHYNCQLLGNTSESFWYAMYAEIVCIVDFKCIRYFNKWKEFNWSAS